MSVVQILRYACENSAGRLVGEASMPGVKASPIDIQVRGIDEAERFYRAGLGCTEFETTCESLKFNWGRNRIHCSLSAQAGTAGKGARIYRLSAGKYQVLANFTVELTRKEWNAVAKKLRRRRVGFTLGVSCHSKNQPEPALFLVDPSGNVVELKATRSPRGQQRQRFYRLAAGISVVVAMAAVVWWASEARTDSFHVQEQPPPTTRPSCAASFFCGQ